METQDLEHIRFVTKHFNDLQGLQYAVPFGLVTLTGGAVAAGFLKPPAAWFLSLGAVVLMVGARQYYRRTFGVVEQQQVGQAAQLEPLSIFNGAGLRLRGFPLVTPVAHLFLTTMGLGFALFLIALAVTPSIELSDVPWMSLNDVGLFGPRPGWKPWRPVSYEAVLAQAILVLQGSAFLAVWLWRERRSSQRRYLVLAAVLLGLAAFGTFLGNLVGEEREGIVRIINFFLPVVVQPWLTLLVCGSAMVFAGLLDHRQLVRTLGRPVASRKEEQR